MRGFTKNKKWILFVCNTTAENIVVIIIVISIFTRCTKYTNRRRESWTSTSSCYNIMCVLLSSMCVTNHHNKRISIYVYTVFFHPLKPLLISVTIAGPGDIDLRDGFAVRVRRNKRVIIIKLFRSSLLRRRDVFLLLIFNKNRYQPPNAPTPYLLLISRSWHRFGHSRSTCTAFFKTFFLQVVSKQFRWFFVTRFSSRYFHIYPVGEI